MDTTTVTDLSSSAYTDITTEHSLDTGGSQKYFIQNIGGTTIFMQEASSLPGATTKGHPITEKGREFTQSATLTTYLIGYGGTGQYVISEAS